MNLTTTDLMQIFNVSYMTVYNWRNPKSNSDKTVLPSHTEKFGTQRHRVYFKWGEVKKWAKKNKVVFVLTPEDLGIH
ncbi:MAG TPA: hypothetical protein VMW50_12170 [Dehalococcoidia bacterium]|nr:hypothetical protein [Dehalococcoidia bacterium]